MSTQVSRLHDIAPDLVHRLGAVGGVRGVMLGGSRARGDHNSESDYDLGLYYTGDLDVDGIQMVADDYSATPSRATTLGEWGPWVDGGAWLDVDGIAVDIIYRDLERVANVWTDCRVGRYTNEMQTGHPLGFWSHAYAGEVALGIVVDDADGQLAELQAEVADYPDALADALVAGLWEASFSISNARKASGGADVSYVAGCLFRATGIITQAVHGAHHRWLINEKGAVAATGALLTSPVDFVSRVNGAFCDLDGDPVRLRAACDALQAVADDAAP